MNIHDMITDITLLPVVVLMNCMLLICTYDIICWCVSLFQHASEAKKQINNHNKISETDTPPLCSKITHRMLACASVLSGIHIVLINISWIYFKVYFGYNLIVFMLIVGVDVMVIHLYALLARCTELEKKEWPLFSSLVANSVVSPCKRFLLKAIHND